MKPIQILSEPITESRIRGEATASAVDEPMSEGTERVGRSLSLVTALLIDDSWPV
ncbi:hypothetical protein ABNG03_02085 [Halorubrum sp. RMP-47]|uniref:Uncharacterized protein n=1 Tax=Halorubrum miltondacostae TaxID=3076378 RepID=A0ABD5M245_9EURY